VKISPLKNNTYLVVGRAGMDLYADPPGAEIETAGRFQAELGGSAANIAVAIAKLGGSASLVSTVSDDAVGRFVLASLKNYGIGTPYVTAIKGESRTSLAVVESRFENCQSVIYRNNAADFQLTQGQVDDLPYQNFGALVATGTNLAVEPSRSATFSAFDKAAVAGVPVVLDIDYRPYSWIEAKTARDVCLKAAECSDIVIGNDVEFALLSGNGDGVAVARQLAKREGRIVVYKMGEKGSMTFTPSEAFETGIYPVTPLKPTGAGDAFLGGFITGLAEGRDLRDCVKRGSAAAAIVVTRVGCAPACPTNAELQAFMNQHV
jgi:5-dehydro-2-deoxygluconokinase